MTYWQMAMRDDSRGPDMLPRCKERGIAAITYRNLRDVDLTPFNRDKLPKQWVRQKGFSPGAMGHFAFDMQCGDVIFVKDSVEKGIVGCGVVRGPSGSRAYRFEQVNPVVTDSGYPWRHYVNVDWIENYLLVPHTARAPLLSVLELSPEEISKFGQQLCNGQINPNLSEIKQSLKIRLIEASHLRSSPAALIEIVPRHRMLSNEFADWLATIGATDVIQENNWIDITFHLNGIQFMAELKICYGGNTSAAIREALGQIFEYNLRYKRESHNKWLLILDCAPLQEDTEFVRRLRQEHNAPLFLGWKQARNQFAFDSRWE